jgi:hypothetical protein
MEDPLKNIFRLKRNLIIGGAVAQIVIGILTIIYLAIAVFREDLLVGIIGTAISVAVIVFSTLLMISKLRTLSKEIEESKKFENKA